MPDSGKSLTAQQVRDAHAVLVALDDPNTRSTMSLLDNVAMKMEVDEAQRRTRLAELTDELMKLMWPKDTVVPVGGGAMAHRVANGLLDRYPDLVRSTRSEVDHA